MLEEDMARLRRTHISFAPYFFSVELVKELRKSSHSLFQDKALKHSVLSHKRLALGDSSVRITFSSKASLFFEAFLYSQQ